MWFISYNMTAYGTNISRFLSHLSCHDCLITGTTQSLSTCALWRTSWFSIHPGKDRGCEYWAASISLWWIFQWVFLLVCVFWATIGYSVFTYICFIMSSGHVVQIGNLWSLHEKLLLWHWQVLFLRTHYCRYSFFNKMLKLFTAHAVYM